MFFDLYGRSVILLPNSGADTEAFYFYSVMVSRNISLIKSPIRGGLLSKISGIIFYLVGQYRFFGQYINVLFGISIIILIYQIMNMLKINKPIITLILLLASFFPNSIIMSAIFLREVPTAFFCLLSFKYFIKWFIGEKASSIVLTLFFLGVASILHSGVISFIIGYAFMFLFYSAKKKHFYLSIKSFFIFLVIIFITFFSYTKYKEVFFNEFSNINSIYDVYDTANTRIGGSAYLVNIKINNFVQLITYGPVKMLFFISSPLPMDWRNIIDIMSFFLDSLLYLYIIYFYIRFYFILRKRSNLVLGMFILLLTVSFVFGIGVSNAGTAIRHRQKIFPVFVLFYGIMLNETRFKKKFIYE